VVNTRGSLIPTNLATLTYFYAAGISGLTVTISKEYVLLDTAALIGSVGGSLGLFIGFSFSGFIETMFNYLKKAWKKLIQRRKYLR